MDCKPYLIAACTLLCLAGCDSSQFPLAPATGRVTIDGQPYTKGKIMFAPIAKPGEIESGKAAFGLLDQEGRFELSTYKEGDGAVVGEHWVTVFSMGPGSPVPFSRIQVPTGRFTVVSGESNQFEIELTSAMIAEHGEAG